jgi:glycosyltransferase involved in cell wall biosynthesis
LGTAENGVHGKNLALSWYGDYLSYISKIYGQDCHAMVDESPSKRFSIVIPARNSSDTLRYTLQTCLEQRYTGDYEIIVSDNSTGHNAAVYELCQELNNPRIVYLKTPRDLPLAKSFEYAYLHAKGEYIFAIGSDDGLLPWALEILDGIAQQYPDEEIIQWTRAFYAWSGFNGGQQHQFIIPRKYKKGEIPMGYREALDYIDMIL